MYHNFVNFFKKGNIIFCKPRLWSINVKIVIFNLYGIFYILTNSEKESLVFLDRNNPSIQINKRCENNSGNIENKSGYIINKSGNIVNKNGKIENKKKILKLK